MSGFEPGSEHGAAVTNLGAAGRAPAVATEQAVSRAATAADLASIEVLHDRVFGPGALTRSAYRIREGQPRVTPFCRVLHCNGVLISAIRFTAIQIGGEGQALMLGPLAVAPEFANQGHGRRLIAEGLDGARAVGIAAILLVGDPLYYARFGFQRVPPGRIQMPGPFDPARLLIAELTESAASRYQGRLAGAT